MRSLILAVAALTIPASAFAVEWTPEAIIGVGPGYTVAARDANAADEGVDTYLDFGVRLTNHVSFGMRDTQLAADRTIHHLSGWVRADLTRYAAAEFIPYGKLAFGEILASTDGITPDISNGLWSFIAGCEYKQSGVFSLFAEGEGAWSVQSQQVDTVALKLGALFRFGGGQP